MIAPGLHCNNVYLSYMENIDPALVQQFLQTYSENQEGDASPSFNLFPQELIDMFAIGIIALIVISSLFLVVYLIGTIRKWRVQSAVLDIHRDVKELKQHFEGQRSQTKIDRDTEKIA